MRDPGVISFTRDSKDSQGGRRRSCREEVQESQDWGL